MAANEVVWAHSDETGAATLNNSAGTLVAVLDAFLISGFRAQSLTSLVVSGGVATGTLAGHGYEPGKMIEIGGATPSGLNGRKLIAAGTSGTFTFDATGIANGAASGSISCKRSPLGWSKVASGTNKAIYARTDVTATTQLLRVDDTATGSGLNYARVLMLESFVDIDNYTASAGQISGGAYWTRGYANDSTPKPWVLVGDSKTLYLFTDIGNGSSGSWNFATLGALQPRMFGDLASYRAGDPYCCAIGGDVNATSSPAVGLSCTGLLGSNATNNGSFMVARLSSQLPGSGTTVFKVAPNQTGALIGAVGPLYPSPVDNGMVINGAPLVTENLAAFNYPVRGRLRGEMHPLANVGNRLHKQTLSGVTGAPGVVLAVAVGYQASAGCLMYDLTGPW